MIERTSILIACAVLACMSLPAPGQPPDEKKDEAEKSSREPQKKTAMAVDQHGPTIKDVYKDHFLIGTAGDLPGNFSDEELKLVKENFNVLTPENCMKPGPVHPSEDTWKFERCDALVQWCLENGIAIHGHTLVWHSQTNNWFFADGDAPFSYALLW